MKLRHICEVCGKDEILTPEEAFEDGWDYPPRMGAFGVISARTCGDCLINQTVWWAVMQGQNQFTPEQMAVVERIRNEPASIMVEE
ncbi:hypothetical protein FHT44_005032 [Mycolicibacterium sp. BK634]|uniref:hypothetical protein n=1 Tax=Mycolicibacterium sp. BK634 TaxID=2587099 RepID=UPI00160B6B8D|nr:hypothetical protein [Mycolicibacterium sp. BK634]MBB3752520.1 hypothetical protein [Mycolicibacterium sp. BK634]